MSKGGEGLMIRVAFEAGNRVSRCMLCQNTGTQRILRTCIMPPTRLSRSHSNFVQAHRHRSLGSLGWEQRGQVRMHRMRPQPCPRLNLLDTRHTPTIQRPKTCRRYTKGLRWLGWSGLLTEGSDIHDVHYTLASTDSLSLSLSPYTPHTHLHAAHATDASVGEK